MDVNTALHLFTLIFLFVVSLFIYKYLPSYFGEKGRNLATKEDIGEITAKVEEVRQIYSSELEVLKAQLALANAKALLYSTEYIERISQLWSQLQELRRIGDQLWNTATPSALAHFSDNLLKTRIVLEKSSLFLSTDEYDGLKRVLNQFERFQIGKQALITLRSRNDVERVLNEIGEMSASDSKSATIENEIIHGNGDIKAQYETLMDLLGRRLRSQLDVTLPM